MSVLLVNVNTKVPARYDILFSVAIGMHVYILLAVYFLQNFFGGYSCTCTEYYTGQDCENDINECLDDNWCNGGTCTVRHIISI